MEMQLYIYYCGILYLIEPYILSLSDVKEKLNHMNPDPRSSSTIPWAMNPPMNEMLSSLFANLSDLLVTYIATFNL